MREFDLGSGAQMSQRRYLAETFYQAVLDPEEHPCFVSDEATIWDISTDDPAALVDRCQHHYGVELRHDDLALPVWKLLDYLEARRTRF